MNRLIDYNVYQGVINWLAISFSCGDNKDVSVIRHLPAESSDNDQFMKPDYKTSSP